MQSTGLSSLKAYTCADKQITNACAAVKISTTHIMPANHITMMHGATQTAVAAADDLQ
jgi:hypothetical protein